MAAGRPAARCVLTATARAISSASRRHAATSARHQHHVALATRLDDLHLHPLVTNRAHQHQALIRAPRALLLLRLRHRQPLPRRDMEAAAAAAAAARPQGEARRALPAAGLAADDDRGQEADPALVPAHGRPAAQALVRMHARKGNSNSFVADFESRLDRVLYRCNAVPSIFAARMAIGHKHVMVNGKITNSTHYLMKPGDVVEPAPGSLPLFERFLRRRLANNSFVFAKDGQPSPQKQIAPPKTPTIQANFGQLLADGAAVAATYRRLPPPREAGGGGGGGGAAASASGGASATAAAPLLTWPAGRQAQLDAIVPSLLVALAGEGSGLASEVAKRRGELSVVAPPQPARRGTAPPAATLAWQPDAPPTGSGSKALLTLDRVRLRRLLLGLLALRPA